MPTDIILYEPPHPHLLYTLGLTLVAWTLVELYCRRSLGRLPGVRVIVYAFLIVLPLCAEGGARLIDYMRPAPDTGLGSMITHFHAHVLDRIPIDSFLPPRLEHAILGALLAFSTFSIARLLYGSRRLKRMLAPACPIGATAHRSLAARLTQLAEQQSLVLPPISVLPLDLPLALTAGLFRPHIYLAERLLTVLSEEEALVVVCHELAHAQRRDNLWNASVRVLRDVLWFLPGAHLAWQAMIASQDEACDARAAVMTGKPLVLARALVRVAGAWNGVALPIWPAAAPFALPSNTLEARVRHMLALGSAGAERPGTPRGAYALCAMLLVLGVLPALLGS
jgi:Zn-dependent protease with chaperone function